MARIIILVMDGVGCGELEDAKFYNDVGAHTLKHISDSFSDPLNIPTLEKLSLKRLGEMKHNNLPLISAYGKMRESSPGKDSVTGHWEIAGLHLSQAFPVYPNGFPTDFMQTFCQKTKRGFLGNIPAAGTAIIKELGEEHLKTGKLIIYTSADSVFQIAANESIVPITTLYEYCEIAREMLRGKHEVGRVIARPFIGTRADNFVRTKYRKDYSVIPPQDSILDLALKIGYESIGVGKIDDLFAGKGLSQKIHAKGNRECMAETVLAFKNNPNSLIFTNLVDFDMLFGHQRDVLGFKKELELFDTELAEFLKLLNDEDLLFITADHGNDPTFLGTDHTREFVPLIVYHNRIKPNIDLGIRSSFADIANTIADYLKINNHCLQGESFLSKIY